jgi:hypothetical protein
VYLLAAVPGDARARADALDRRRRIALLVTTACTLVVATSVLVRLAAHEQFTQDTTAVIDGSHRALTCLAHGVFTKCAYHPRHSTTGVNPYPLLQYLPTAILVKLRFSDSVIRDLLAWFNAAAVVLATAIVVLYARRQGGARAAVVAAAAMVSGMLVSYAGATVGEPLAVLAFVIVGVLALRTDASIWLGFAAFFAVIGKETFFPVVVLYALGAVLLSAGSRDGNIRKLVIAGSGVCAGVLAQLAFNLFRFGELRNVQYLHQATRPAPLATAKSAVSLLFAPNGGLLFFWFAGAAALIIVAVITVRRVWTARSRMSDNARRIAGPAAILLGFAVAVGSLSLWWMPFGWYAWGPRLLLPFVPPLFLVVARLVGRPTQRQWRVGLVLTAVAWLLMIPNLAFVWAPTEDMVHWLATVSENPACAALHLRASAGIALFHDCLMTAAWRLSHMPLAAAVSEASQRDAAWCWLTYGAGTAALASAVVAAATESDSSEISRATREESALAIDEKLGTTAGR